MSKGQSKNGVRLTINNSSPYSTMIITDIDVEPGIDTVILDIGNSLPPYVSGEVQLKKVNKQFTDVKTLIFGGRVTSAEISNYMFPNVTHITVQACSSKRYITKKLVGRNGCLMAVATSAKGNIIEYKLLNTFCKKPGEEIDLKDVSSIEDYAFEGCMSTNVINTDDITTLSRKSFAGSAFHIGGDFTNGVKCFNRMIVDIDTTAKEIDIPEDIRISGIDIPENFRFDKITIHSKKSISAITSNVGNFFSGCDIPCDVLYMDFENDEFDSSILRTINTKAFKLSDKNRFCAEYDGVLYNRNKDTLICCPSKKTGALIIPEGVKYIADYSCSKIDITKLKLPDSLRSIGNLAFSKDEKLTEIDFGHGIKNLGSGENDSIFFLCIALTSIEIPSNVESIGSNAFKGCRNLSNVILNEGLENVGPGAFNGCNLTEITIPKSVKKVHDFSFQGVKRVNIKGILPAYFLHAILKTDNGMQYDDSFNIVEITDGQNKLFFPMYLESDDKSVLQHNLNYKTLAEVVEDENFISKPGEYSKHIEVKQDMAIKIYGHNQDSEIRTYLRRIATNITKRYISKKDEDGLVEFLKFNLMTTTAINKILPQVENAGMTSATAYLLNAINNAGGNQKTFKI